MEALWIVKGFDVTEYGEAGFCEIGEAFKVAKDWQKGSGLIIGGVLKEKSQVSGLIDPPKVP